MKYLAIADAVLWALFYGFYRWSNTQGDDFSAAFPALFFGALAIAGTVGLIIWAIIHGALS